MADEPLLFITTPRFMTEPTNPIKAPLETEEIVDEISNRLIANQLRFLARQTIWPAKDYVVVLKSREKVIGIVSEIIGARVILQTGNEQRQLNGNDIIAIYKR